MIDGVLTTQGWNRYSYCKGNPVKYKDPTGHNTISADHSEGSKGPEPSDTDTSTDADSSDSTGSGGDGGNNGGISETISKAVQWAKSDFKAKISAARDTFAGREPTMETKKLQGKATLAKLGYMKSEVKTFGKTSQKLSKDDYKSLSWMYSRTQRDLEGAEYELGARDPRVAGQIDCSGAVTWGLRKLGLLSKEKGEDGKFKVDYNAAGLYSQLSASIDKKDEMPGDLVFYGTAHVITNTGKSEYIHPSSGSNEVIRVFSTSYCSSIGPTSHRRLDWEKLTNDYIHDK